MLVLNRSDYGPFRTRKIPYLFFSTGENPCYHSPKDTADTLNYPKLTAISRVILGVVRQATVAAEVPAWRPLPDNPLAEAVAVRDVLRTLLEHRQALKIAPAQTLLMTNTLRSLDAIVARGVDHPGRADRDGQRRSDRPVLGVLSASRISRPVAQRGGGAGRWVRGGAGRGGTRWFTMAPACCSNSGKRGMNGGATWIIGANGIAAPPGPGTTRSALGFGLSGLRLPSGSSAPPGLPPLTSSPVRSTR